MEDYQIEAGAEALFNRSPVTQHARQTWLELPEASKVNYRRMFADAVDAADQAEEDRYP